MYIVTGIYIILLMSVIIFNRVNHKRLGQDVHEGHQKQHHKKHKKHQHDGNINMDYFAINSGMRHWNTSFKCIFALGSLILCITLDHPWVSAMIGMTMALVTIEFGRMDVHEYIQILTLPLSFIVLSVLPICIGYSSRPTGDFSLGFGMVHLYVTYASLKLGGAVALKVLASMTALFMLALSTPSFDFIAVLKKLHVPNLFVELMLMIYRYIFMLMSVMMQMKNAADARNGYCDFITSCRTFGKVAANLLVVSLKKASTYYEAMEARCYDGEFMMLEERMPLNYVAVLLLIGYYVFLVALKWMISL